jgi:hypothetical protein
MCAEDLRENCSERISYLTTVSKVLYGALVLLAWHRRNSAAATAVASQMTL